MTKTEIRSVNVNIIYAMFFILSWEADREIKVIAERVRKRMDNLKISKKTKYEFGDFADRMQVAFEKIPIEERHFRFIEEITKRSKTMQDSFREEYPDWIFYDNEAVVLLNIYKHKPKKRPNRKLFNKIVKEIEKKW